MPIIAIITTKLQKNPKLRNTQTSNIDSDTNTITHIPINAEKGFSLLGGNIKPIKVKTTIENNPVG